VDLIDFSVGFPRAEEIKRAGIGGVIGYFSARRAGWMLAKPMTWQVVQDYRAAGLEIVCNYQFGKNETADWRGGHKAGVDHATRMRDMVYAAGLDPFASAMYGPVDDNPTERQYQDMIKPFFQGWQEVFGKELSGAYCNVHVLRWLQRDGLCSYFWQHGWDGRPPGQSLMAHPSAHILQYEIDKIAIDGIGVDRNRTLKEDFGQVGLDSGDWLDNRIQLMGPP
jgi:Domain of unknown function (DUF1906)